MNRGPRFLFSGKSWKFSYKYALFRHRFARTRSNDARGLCPLRFPFGKRWRYKRRLQQASRAAQRSSRVRCTSSSSKTIMSVRTAQLSCRCCGSRRGARAQVVSSRSFGAAGAWRPLQMASHTSLIRVSWLQLLRAAQEISSKHLVLVCSAAAHCE